MTKQVKITSLVNKDDGKIGSSQSTARHECIKAVCQTATIIFSFHIQGFIQVKHQLTAADFISQLSLTKIIYRDQLLYPPDP